MTIRRVVVALVLVLGCGGRVLAQAGTGMVRGRVTGAADRAPVSYALVRLAPVGTGAPPRTALTDAEGAFAFAAVAPGTYRLQLERIGFGSEATEAFTVAADQTVERDIRSAPRAVAIQGIVATAECRTAGNLAQSPSLAALWAEAVKAVETRRAFDDAYHYEFDMRQYSSYSERNGGALDSVVRHVTMDPRNRMDRNRSGWGRVSPQRMTLEIPDGHEILDPAFLRSHCLDGGLDEEAGVYTLGFRPQRSRRGRIDIRGELRLDRATLQVTSIEVEWTDAARVLMEATVEYTEATVPGGTVRLPLGAVFSGTAPASMHIGQVRGQVQFVNYGRLEKVR
ncbi:carboxypeptidase-like regulatory domain-containing protein [Longimicrobium sp.]|uniref:carboxypeptidase-like regulatory domain-containing protein n=1 Tax=Longimicrobium sp. TaxID=2029185 RepID=UPI002BEA3938|nr:carboxypeptidase-like regulatory domain-containing protein [Longimicrobium sp.]HSU12940.1 carboxypeptidase-like regulatory domain-containing protein [Longimicrobium sp.]